MSQCVAGRCADFEGVEDGRTVFKRRGNLTWREGFIKINFDYFVISFRWW